METIMFESTKELKRTKEELEDKLKVKILIGGRRVSFDGDALDLYEARMILEAMAFGFSAQKALQLKAPDMMFKIMHIKDHTRRKNMKEIKARLIGTEGKTKKTVELIIDGDIIKKNEIGIIAPADTMDNAVQAITNLIKGSKQANMYNFLERMNTYGKVDEGLGIREDNYKKGKDSTQNQEE